MIDWGENDFFLAKDGTPSILTRRPTTKRWFRAVSIHDLRKWWQRCTFEVQQELRNTLYIGDGVRMYNLCVKHFHDLFLMDDVLELRKETK